MFKCYEGEKFGAYRISENEWKIVIDEFEDVIFVNPEVGESVIVAGDDDDGIMRFKFENGAVVTITWDEDGVLITKWGDVDLGELDYLFERR